MGNGFEAHTNVYILCECEQKRLFLLLWWALIIIILLLALAEYCIREIRALAFETQST